MTRMEFCELLGDLEDRHIKEARESRGRRALIKWASLAACLCLTVVAGLGILHHPTAAPWNFGEAKPSGQLVINPLNSGLTNADIDAEIKNYHNASAAQMLVLKAEFQANLGMNYDEFVNRIPKVWQTDMYCYTVSVSAPPLSGHYVLHDYVFESRLDDETRLKIAVCHGDQPLRCVVYEKQAITSNISGVEVTAYGIGDFCLVQFSHNGNFYDVETYGMLADEVETLIIRLVTEKDPKGS